MNVGEYRRSNSCFGTSGCLILQVNAARGSPLNSFFRHEKNILICFFHWRMCCMRIPYPVSFFLFPKSQLIPIGRKYKKILYFHRCMCCMCLSSYFFLFPHSQLMPTERKYCVFTGTCAACVSRLIFFYSLIRNLFSREENIVFSQVHVLHAPLVPFFLFPNSQLIPKCTKHCVFTGKCCMCISSHFFYSLIHD